MDIIQFQQSAWAHYVCSVTIRLDVEYLPRLWLSSGFRPAVKALGDLSPEHVCCIFQVCNVVKENCVCLCILL